MVTGNETFAHTIIKVMHSFSLKAKLTDRKNEFIVYLKDGESIINLLSVIGAHNAMMELENVRIVKEMRNNVNRVVNCETANLNKVVKAAMRQVHAIRYIDEHGGLGQLESNLQQIARLRLEHQDVSLNDLVEFADGLGKSGINHRLKKLQEIAVALGMEVEQGK
jgi:DNA-binding protein WhiA